MQINIKPDFKLDREGVHKTWPSDQEIFRNYVCAGVASGMKEGLRSDDRRLWNKIEAALDEAVDAKAEFVDLNAVQVAFIKKAFDKATMPVHETKHFMIVEGEINKLAE